MYEWLTWSVLAVAILSGVFCLVWGAIGKIPNDYTLLTSAVTTLGVLIQIPVSIIAPLTGNTPTGDLLEFWMYLVTAALIMAGAIFWSLIERNRWSSIILGVEALSIAVMFLRMHVIWNIQEIAEAMSTQISGGTL